MFKFFHSSLRRSLSLILGLLVVLLLLSNATFLIYQTYLETNQSVLTETRSFATLTVEDLVNTYQTDLVQKRTPTDFEKTKEEILELNPNLASFEILTYEGSLLYTSKLPALEQLDSSTPLTSPQTLTRLKSYYPSILTTTNEIYYLKPDSQNPLGFTYTNQNGDTISPPPPHIRIQDLLIRSQDNTHALLYTVSYLPTNTFLWNSILTILISTAIALIVTLLLTFFLIGYITAPLSRLASYVRNIIKKGHRQKVEVHSQNEVGQLAHSFNHMLEDLSNYEKALQDQTRIQTELNLASEIQKNLIPASPPTHPNLEIAAHLSPATEVGGDCYDFFPKDENLLFYIGDVTGHGVPAGTVVSIANALFYYFSQQNCSTTSLLNNINQVLHPKTKPNMFLTALTCLWNNQSQTLQYTSAGHEPPFHFSAQNQKVTSLPAGGIALAMLPQTSNLLEEKSLPFASGDYFLLYTDGIPEAWGPPEKEGEDHSFYGFERFQKSFHQHASSGLPAQEVLDNILQDLTTFRQQTPVQDDITLILLRRT